MKWKSRTLRHFVLNCQLDLKNMVSGGAEKKIEAATFKDVQCMFILEFCVKGSKSIKVFIQAKASFFYQNTASFYLHISFSVSIQHPTGHYTFWFIDFQ